MPRLILSSWELQSALIIFSGKLFIDLATIYSLHQVNIIIYKYAFRL